MFLFQIPLSLKENKILGEVGIVFKKAHRNIILVLPPSKQKVEKRESISQKNIAADKQTETETKKTDELKENKKLISPASDVSEQAVDVKSDTPVKKKIIKVKTVKAGTKTVKIKSEKTTTVTLENGVTEVKKKTIKQQTDTTTIQLPNGVTNGVTSEECTVTNSIHTTNGDHFEEKNIEITCSQSDNIEPIYIEEHLDLSARPNSSIEIYSNENKADEHRLGLSINELDQKSLRKDRSVSPVEIASYNFVVGKKNLKQRLVTESESVPSSDKFDALVGNEQEPSTQINCNETNGTLSESEKPIFLSDTQNSLLTKEVNQTELDEHISSTCDSHAKTIKRSETSPARFQIKLNDSSNVQPNEDQKETFLRSEVSPARFTIKLSKKKVEELDPNRKVRAEPECSTIVGSDSFGIGKIEPEVCGKIEIGIPQDEVNLKVKVGATSITILNKDVEKNPNAQIKQIDSNIKLNSESEFKAISDSIIAVEVDVVPKDIINSKTEATTKVDANYSEDIPKIESVCKSEINNDFCKKSVKSKIDSKAEGETEISQKAEVGLKEVVLKKTKKLVDSKLADTVNGLSTTEGTTEGKKKLLKKVTNPSGEVKKKVVKKIIGADNGTTGEVKKVVKKKSEVSNATEVATEVKIKVTKKKLDAVEEQLKANNIEDPKVEDSENVGPGISVLGTEQLRIVESKSAEEIERKMDKDHNNLRNDTSPLETLEKTALDQALSLPGEDARDTAVLELDNDLSLGSNIKKCYDETPLFISTTQPEQHDLSLGLPLSDKNRRERQMLGMDDDLALGASASPVESKSETSNNYIPLAICDTPSSSTDYVGKLYSGKTTILRGRVI